MATDYITFEAFEDEIKSLLFPDISEPENMAATHRAYIVDALIDLQRWVEGSLLDFHVDRYPLSATYWNCGMSVIEAPRGKLLRLFTVDQSDECARIDYTRVERGELEAWLKERRCATVTDPLGAYYVDDAYVDYPDVGAGFTYPDTTTDSRCGRATHGLWALHNCNLYIGPAIQSYEIINLEWIGLKRKYADSDLVPDEDDLKSAVRAYVQMQIAKHWKRDTDLFVLSKAEYEEKRADLIYDYRQETRVDNPQAQAQYRNSCS